MGNTSLAYECGPPRLDGPMKILLRVGVCREDVTCHKLALGNNMQAPTVPNRFFLLIFVSGATCGVLIIDQTSSIYTPLIPMQIPISEDKEKLI